MELQITKREKARIRMALQGPSGSGKTLSSLLIAYGLCKDWDKIAVIDSENYSAALYSDVGQFSILNLTPPFHPEKYIEAIKLCESVGKEVIILDSNSHEWEGAGGILETHGNMTGNSFTNWSKLTPRHNAFIQAIIHSSAHVIATIRSKQDYVLAEKNGRHVPEKVGLKGVQREGMDYEFTLVFDLDIKHNATASKDRTRLFMDKPGFILTIQTGEDISNWCMQGRSTGLEITKRIEGCKSLEELLSLYQANPDCHDSYLDHFTKKKEQLQKTIFKNLKNLQNGNNSIHK